MPTLCSVSFCLLNRKVSEIQCRERHQLEWESASKKFYHKSDIFQTLDYAKSWTDILNWIDTRLFIHFCNLFFFKTWTAEDPQKEKKPKQSPAQSQVGEWHGNKRTREIHKLRVNFYQMRLYSCGYNNTFHLNPFHRCFEHSSYCKTILFFFFHTAYQHDTQTLLSKHSRELLEQFNCLFWVTVFIVFKYYTWVFIQLLSYVLWTWRNGTVA